MSKRWLSVTYRPGFVLSSIDSRLAASSSRKRSAALAGANASSGADPVVLAQVGGGGGDDGGAAVGVDADEPFALKQVEGSRGHGV